MCPSMAAVVDGQDGYNRMLIAVFSRLVRIVVLVVDSARATNFVMVGPGPTVGHGPPYLAPHDCDRG